MYQPIYTITNKILKNIGIIEASREVIDHAPLLPYYEKKFQNDALVRSVHYGTHIEGNELNLSQAERVVMGQHIVARERDIQEVINYRKVIEFIGQEGIENGQQIISEDFLFHLHKLTVAKILPSETMGKYRQSQVVIKSSETGSVVFRPPAPVEVPYQMASFISFINSAESKEIHPVLRSGIVHYEFVRIHPFVDGNGRVARALSTMVLFQEGYDIRKFFSLEEYFDSDAGRYYDSLQSVERKQGDLTPWLEYFTEGLAVELTKIKERVEHVSIDGKMREKLGGKPLMLSDRQLKIIEFIQQAGYLQNQAFKSLFPMISEDAVLLDLKSLLQQGIIKKQGVTKGAKYVMAK
ncbi:MAG TPA: Fic family protein [Patescibacteria group bacterium]|nr:Fic family protein [Patescibacteria group bacterium]